MSIARLKKVSICGLQREKRDVLMGLQRLGCMHLLTLRGLYTLVHRIHRRRHLGVGIVIVLAIFAHLMEITVFAIGLGGLAQAPGSGTSRATI